MSESNQHIPSAIQIIHDVLAGYRELVYKIVIANTTVLAALSYFAGVQELTVGAYVALASAALVLGAVSIWWLLCIKSASDRHAEEMRALWLRLDITWVPRAKHPWARMWSPVLVFAGAETLLAVVWVLVQLRS